MVGIFMKKTIIYEILFAVLAIIAVSLAFMDIANKIAPAYYGAYIITDRVILIIFAIDYFYRFIKAEEKLRFFKSNIFDLLAIIPFDSFFRALRIVRLLRIAKTLRFALYFKRFTSKASTFLRTNGLIYVIYLTCSSILIASVGIYFVEQGLTMNSFADALWWSFVTATTVGYGDISPATGTGRIIAAILMLIGIGFIGMLTGTIATFFIKLKNKPALHENQILHLEDMSKEQYQKVLEYAEYIKAKHG